MDYGSFYGIFQYIIYGLHVKNVINVLTMFVLEFILMNREKNFLIVNIQTNFDETMYKAHIYIYINAHIYFN